MPAFVDVPTSIVNRCRSVAWLIVLPLVVQHQKTLNLRAYQEAGEGYACLPAEYAEPAWNNYQLGPQVDLPDTYQLCSSRTSDNSLAQTRSPNLDSQRLLRYCSRVALTILATTRRSHTTHLAQRCINSDEAKPGDEIGY